MIVKKKLLIAAVSLCVVWASTGAHALDFIAGARAGYFVWRPYFQDMKGSGVEELETGSGVLYGPAVSIIFNEKITLSGVALFGRQLTYWDNDNTTKPWGPYTIVSTGNFNAEIGRIDVDSALSYRLSNRFKVFLGYKYQYTETRVTGTFLATETSSGDEYVYVMEAFVKAPAHGPALGIGYSQTMGSNFFFSVNLSGLYMFSKHKFVRDRVTVYEATGAVNQIVFKEVSEGATGREYETQQVGLNVEPMAGMSIGNVIATLGFRLQWVRIRFIDEPLIGTVPFGPTDWMDDFLYGVFVGALYKL